MKKCPKCSAEYFEDMLEFCLDDGTRLNVVKTHAEPKAGPNLYPAPHAHIAAPISNSAETVVIPKNKSGEDLALAGNPAESGSNLWELSGLGLALVHNWWQWVYLEKVYIYSLTEFLLSANFIMWLLLLSAGVTVNIFVLRRSDNKILGATSMITLAINLLLFLVPRR